MLYLIVQSLLSIGSMCFASVDLTVPICNYHRLGRGGDGVAMWYDMLRVSHIYQHILYKYIILYICICLKICIYLYIH